MAKSLQYTEKLFAALPVELKDVFTMGDPTAKGRDGRVGMNYATETELSRVSEEDRKAHNLQAAVSERMPSCLD